DNQVGVERRTLIRSALERPLPDLDKKAVRELLTDYDKLFELIEKGTKRETCDLGLTEAIRREGYSGNRTTIFLTDEVSQLLELKARLEMAEGKFSEAFNTIRTGMTLARQVGEQPGMAAYFGGLELAERMLDAAELLIMQRGAPNLSHALASMPSPYISMRRGLEGERVTLWSAFPGMAESVRGGTLKPLSPQDALNISDRLVALAD